VEVLERHSPARTANVGSYSMPTDVIVALVMTSAFGIFAASATAADSALSALRACNDQ